MRRRLEEVNLPVSSQLCSQVLQTHASRPNMLSCPLPMDRGDMHDSGLTADNLLQNRRLTRTWKICQNQHTGTDLPSQNLPSVTVSLLAAECLLNLSDSSNSSETEYWRSALEASTVRWLRRLNFGRTLVELCQLVSCSHGIYSTRDLRLTTSHLNYLWRTRKRDRWAYSTTTAHLHLDAAVELGYHQHCHLLNSAHKTLGMRSCVSMDMARRRKR